MANRIIKFRGKCTRSGDWVYGDLIHGVGHKKGNLYILPSNTNLAYVKHCDPLDGVMVTPETIGQFTGLLDKNGKEVYEGDRVKFHYFGFNGSETDRNEIGEILYAPDGMCFVIHSNGRDFLVEHTSHFDEPCIEVIGNIYETLPTNS